MRKLSKSDRRAWAKLAAVLVLAGAPPLLAQKAIPTVPAEQQKLFEDQLAAHPDTPEDYVVGKFRDHDVVFLGEQHHLEQYLEFVQRLIPKLYSAGVYAMGFEFANSEDQELVDRLMSNPIWDEAGAEHILWRCYNLEWVSTGYLEILHTAWQLNHGLKPGAHPFRIVGVNLQSRVTDRAQLLPGEVATALKTRTRVLGLNLFDAININMAKAISKEIIAKKEKALVYGGAGHTYTRFYYQRDGDNGIAAGNLIYNYIGARTMRIVMDGGLQGDTDFGRMLEKLLGERKAAFDVRGGALGTLPFQIKGYLYGSEPGHAPAAGDIMDGYIYLAPRSAWRNDKFISSYLTPQNFAAMKDSWELYSRSEKANSLEDLIRIVTKETEWLGPR